MIDRPPLTSVPPRARPKVLDTSVPFDAPTSEQPAPLSRRALRAQAAAIAAAAAMAATTTDVAVREEHEDALAPVDVTPATIAPASRRARRAAAPAEASPREETGAPAASRDESDAALAGESAVDATDAAPAEAQAAPAERPAAEEHPFARWFAAEITTEADEPEADAASGPAEKPAAERETCEASDPFLEAVRAFGATGQTPIVTPQPAPRPTSEHVAAGRVRAGRMRRIATTAVASVGVMGIVGMLAIGLTTPVGAVAAPAAVQNPAAVAASVDGAETAAAPEDDIQAFVAPADVTGEALEVTAEFESQTFAEIAAAEGINTANAAFTNDPTADIQWPFSVGVGISSYYGYRWGRLHEGVDFVPGNGAPVQAIADGTVRIATESGGAYGVTVYIDHVIDGQLVTSHYAHMQYDSLRVVAGQQVKVGDIIGLTGNTGRSYGAHMHFEIIIGGTTIDPLPWLQQWANTHYPEQQVAGDATAGEDAASSGDGE